MSEEGSTSKVTELIQFIYTYVYIHIYSQLLTGPVCAKYKWYQHTMHKWSWLIEV